jgi:hypothetical protein
MTYRQPLEPTLVIQPKAQPMVKPYISHIVRDAAAAPDFNHKIGVLRNNDHPALRTYLKMALDKNLRWALPEGAPPYTSMEKPIDLEHVLYNELRRVYIFIEGGNPNLSDDKRQALFQTFLEAMHPDDAKFFVDVVKDRRLPEGLTEEIIRFAFPNL